jgi:NAD(P)-dependent dehydrogenase (short-subunit alcohol dehydrogenase family)
MTDSDISSKVSSHASRDGQVETVLVTGPTQGLGRLTTLRLAEMGCHLVLLGRPSAAFDAITSETKNAGARSVTRIDFDAASLRSVDGALKQVVQGRAIDAVVANAGVQLADRVHRSEDGYELTFAVNVLAVQRLITGLLSSLTPNAQIVIVGSGTHFGRFPTTALVAGPVWADPKTLFTPGSELPAGRSAKSTKAGQCAYSSSKLAVNYLMHEANRRHGERVRVNVFDPGMMPGTGLARDLNAFKRFAWNRIMPSLVPVIPGASKTATSAQLLAALTVGQDHGPLRNGYVEIDRVTKASEASFDPQREAELWEFCERATPGNNV